MMSHSNFQRIVGGYRSKNNETSNLLHSLINRDTDKMDQEKLGQAIKLLTESVLPVLKTSMESISEAITEPRLSTTSTNSNSTPPVVIPDPTSSTPATTASIKLSVIEIIKNVDGAVRELNRSARLMTHATNSSSSSSSPSSSTKDKRHRKNKSTSDIKEDRDENDDQSDHIMITMSRFKQLALGNRLISMIEFFDQVLSICLSYHSRSDSPPSLDNFLFYAQFTFYASQCHSSINWINYWVSRSELQVFQHKAKLEVALIVTAIKKIEHFIHNYSPSRANRRAPEEPPPPVTDDGSAGTQAARLNSSEEHQPEQQQPTSQPSNSHQSTSNPFLNLNNTHNRDGGDENEMADGEQDYGVYGDANVDFLIFESMIRDGVMTLSGFPGQSFFFNPRILGEGAEGGETDEEGGVGIDDGDDEDEEYDVGLEQEGDGDGDDDDGNDEGDEDNEESLHSDIISQGRSLTKSEIQRARLGILIFKFMRMMIDKISRSDRDQLSNCLRKLSKDQLKRLGYYTCVLTKSSPGLAFGLTFYAHQVSKIKEVVKMILHYVEKISKILISSLIGRKDEIDGSLIEPSETTSSTRITKKGSTIDENDRGFVYDDRREMLKDSERLEIDWIERWNDQFKLVGQNILSLE